MTERPTNTIPDKKHVVAVPSSHTHAPGHEHAHTHESKAEIKAEAKIEEKKEEKKEDKKVKEVKKIVKKEEARALSNGVAISLKHGMHISRFIKNKSIDRATKELEEVIILKRAIPFSGEIPHRKGMMSGRYPVEASKAFILLLKHLKGNSIANGMDLDKLRITEASVSWASRPLRSGGRHAKRVNMILVAKEKEEKKNG